MKRGYLSVQYSNNENHYAVVKTPQVFKLTRRRLFKLLCCVFLFAIYFIHYPTIQLVTQNSKPSYLDLILSTPSTQRIQHHFIKYASHTHRAGTKRDKHLALWTKSKWIHYGIDTKIETYYPTLNQPKTISLSIDNQPISLVNTGFHAYSGDGNVTGSIVYVNYGRLSDFQHLQVRGIHLNGTIALIRSGKIAKGLKVKFAQDAGCIGAILYPDPDEDGPTTFYQTEDQEYEDKSYPDGPWRSETSVEYGSVQFGVGDPFTSSSKDLNATQIPSSLLPKIPSIPIAWKDAALLLKTTEGFGIPSDITWKGGLCSKYYSGPSQSLVNLVNVNEYKEKPIWNVVGVIKGSEEPENSIIIGNHRDAWHYGAVDPSSGSAVLMEVAKVLGVLQKKGWKPRRTIILCSWDAKEYGSVGSTEWIKEHAPWIKQEAIAYLNVDYAVSGKQLVVQSSPLLYRLLHSAISSVDIKDVEIDYLDTESDHVGFFHHLGISSLSIGFRGQHYGVSHSDSDTIDWMDRFGDPTFEYHQTLTKIWGLLIFELASEAILPLYPQDYITEMKQYINSACGSFPTISSALAKLQDTVTEVESVRKKRRVSKKWIRNMNDKLRGFEQSLILSEGINPELAWYKHLVYGPNLHTGAIQTFPSLSEAIMYGDQHYLKWVEDRTSAILTSAEEQFRH